MGKINKFLISIDFRSDKGGIARVANLMYHSIAFDKVYSLHGSGAKDQILYFNSKTLLFTIKTLFILWFKRPEVVIFDHLNIARMLVFVPKYFLKKVILFVYDEEVWKEVKGLHKVALSKTTDILCISDHSMQKFLKANPTYSDKAKLCLLAGVPEAFLSAGEEGDFRYKDWLKDERPYCIFVSRLWSVHRYKGHFELLKAFKKYYKESSKSLLRLAIIGNGDDAAEVASFIEREGMQGNVKLFTGLNDNELIQFYKNSLALIFPSTREGFGFVFLEAMYFKKACVGITNQPAEEIIINHKTGELLPDNDPETLKNILLDIEHNPDKYVKFGKEGYERYLSNFTNDHFKKRFLLATGL